MEKKESSCLLHFSFSSLTAVYLTILLATSNVVILSGLNQNQIAIAQQQQQELPRLQNSQTSPSSLSLTKQQEQLTLEGISFDIDNMTFSHHMASVNDIFLIFQDTYCNCFP